jgi:hypothetical protein
VIAIRLRDMGTVPVNAGFIAPGMEELYYRGERSYMETINSQSAEKSNAAAKEIYPVTISPFPEPMPGRMWIDWTERYERIGNDGLRFELYHDDLSVGSPLVAAGAFGLSVTTDPDPEVNPADSRLLRELTNAEQVARRGGEWLRAPLRNEQPGGTDLQAPALIYAQDLRGEAFQLAMPDNSLFTPFDFCYPERYIIVSDDDDATQIQEPDQVRAMLAFRNGVNYTLYLRPRRWRYVAETIAHYAWISMFEFVLMDEWFIHSWWDRPPIYPIRHDIMHTSLVSDHWHTYYDPLAYDIGIDDYWMRSPQFGVLTKLMLDAQVWTVSFAYILLGAENCKTTIWRYEPRGYEYVCGIGTHDYATGDEGRFWVMAKPDVDWVTLYPRTILGQFLMTFWVDP